jgi:hypothetical protein
MIRSPRFPGTQVPRRKGDRCHARPASPAWPAQLSAHRRFSRKTKGHPAPSDDRDTVVTGDADQGFPAPGEVTRQARDITGGDLAPIELLPMFSAPLCPRVFGLRADYAATIVVRFRDNAERLDLATTEIRTADGVPVSVDPATGLQEAHQGSAGSRISLPIREDIVWVQVPIDRDAIAGKSLRQLADYATMRGLVRTRPVDADGRPLDTILALFNPSSEPPLGLTAFDSAYVGAVYCSAANLHWMSKVGAVSRELRRQVAAEGPAGAGM